MAVDSKLRREQPKSEAARLKRRSTIAPERATACAMTVTIVDYGAGNLHSVQHALRAVGVQARLESDADALREAERILFPGVGHAQSAMRTLQDRGLDEALRDAVARGIPVLGICVGAQLILDGSEESRIPCLGLIKGTARRFGFTDSALKVPHIGWNEVKLARPHPLLNYLQAGDEFYFVHSYYPDPSEQQHVFATCDYGSPFCCALGRDNLFAAQFHPEKSGPLGLKLLERFSEWDGRPC